MTLKANPTNMEPLQTVIVALTVLGAINWGLYGLMDTDLVMELFAADSTGATAIYAGIGVAGAVLAIEIWTETEVLDVLD